MSVVGQQRYFTLSEPVEIYILNTAERTRLGGRVAVYSKKRDVYCLLFPDFDVYSQKLQVGKFFSCINVDVRGEQKEIRLQKSSRLFKCPAFELGEGVAEFYNAPGGTIADAHASPVKKRMTVSGVVHKIYPVTNGDGWTRRDMVLKDENNDHKITVKLWGNYSSTPLEENSHIQIQNVVVREYNSVKQLNSTQETVIMVRD